MNSKIKSAVFILTAVIAAAALAVAGCNFKSDPRFAARKKLAEIGIAFNKTAFLQRVYEGDTLAAGLFFEGGMPANAEADFGRYLLQPDQDVQRWMNSLNGKTEVWNRMIYGNSGSLGIQGANYHPVMLPVYMVARIKAAGNAPEFREIADMFAKQGVSSEIAQVREERIRNDLRAAETDMAKAEPVVSDGEKDKFFSDIKKGVQNRVGPERGLKQ